MALEHMSTTTSAVIWKHIIQPEKDDLSPDTARYILNMDFRQADHKRMEKLNAKAEEGTLTRKERADLEEYIRVSDLLAIMQSKARRSLRKRVASTPLGCHAPQGYDAPEEWPS
jgi:hypothetical protein